MGKRVLHQTILSLFRQGKIKLPWCSSVLFSTSSMRSKQQSYKFVIAGGGAGGITMAARILSLGEKSVAVIEPSDMHYYQPYWTLVGGRLKNLESSCRPMKNVLPINVTWIKDKAVSFDPISNLVHTGNGDLIKYDFLIVAVGIQLGFDKIKGLTEAFKTKGVCSNYSFHTVMKTAQAIEDFTEGNAIFTQPINPIKCAGAPQKIMYLTEANFKQTGKRKKANIIFNTALDTVFAAPKYAAALREVAKGKDITINYRHSLTEVKPESKEAVFQRLGDKGIPVSTEVFKYEMLHVTPPMVAPLVISGSSLADSTGFVDVNKHTLQHKKFPNVFSIGDCSNVPTSKTAAAVAAQCGVLTENIKAAIKGHDFTKMYNGYTSCPLVTGYGKGILAEFDFDLKPIETLPIDQGKERVLSFFLKKDIIPFIYWNLMLKGNWKGPGIIRKILHLGMK